MGKLAYYALGSVDLTREINSEDLSAIFTVHVRVHFEFHPTKVLESL